MRYSLIKQKKTLAKEQIWHDFVCRSYYRKYSETYYRYDLQKSENHLQNEVEYVDENKVDLPPTVDDPPGVVDKNTVLSLLKTESASLVENDSDTDSDNLLDTACTVDYQHRYDLQKSENHLQNEVEYVNIDLLPTVDDPQGVDKNTFLSLLKTESASLVRYFLADIILDTNDSVSNNDVSDSEIINWFKNLDKGIYRQMMISFRRSMPSWHGSGCSYLDHDKESGCLVSRNPEICYGCLQDEYLDKVYDGIRNKIRQERREKHSEQMSKARSYICAHTTEILFNTIVIAAPMSVITCSFIPISLKLLQKSGKTLISRDSIKDIYSCYEKVR